MSIKDQVIAIIAEQAMLEQIFPDGVCDFDQPDVGLPSGW